MIATNGTKKAKVRQSDLGATGSWLMESGERILRYDAGNKIKQPQNVQAVKVAACGEAGTFQQGEQIARTGDC
jgi:hypothetical protein